MFSFRFCTLVTVYCTCKIGKDAFRIVLYIATFYLQYYAVARFVLKHIRNAVAQHFHSTGHSISDVQVCGVALCSGTNVRRSNVRCC